MSDNPHTQPQTPNKPLSIPIPFATRARSSSMASTTSSSGGSGSITPPNLSTSPSSPPAPALKTPFPATPGSPTLAKFLKTPLPVLPTSPTASRLTGYFSGGGGSAIADEEETDEFRGHALARRLSTGWAAGGRFASQVNGAAVLEQQERGKGIMRRLSLGQAFAKPPVIAPPIQNAPRPAPLPNPASMVTAPAVPSAAPNPTPGPALASPSPRKGGLLAPPGSRTPKKRAVSPMGERILKGQFDGFV